jgi:hypothetical protein
MPGPGKPRALRRAEAREHAKLVRELDRLAALRPGGSAERPLVVESPAQVEPIAAASPCPLCGATQRLVEHTAEEADGVRLRVARLLCTMCGVPRALYFRLAERTTH